MTLLLLDTSTFEAMKIGELSEHSEIFFESSKCVLGKIASEWGILKALILPIIFIDLKRSCLDIGKHVYMNDEMRSDCQNILQIPNLCCANKQTITFKNKATFLKQFIFI